MSFGVACSPIVIIVYRSDFRALSNYILVPTWRDS